MSEGAPAQAAHVRLDVLSAHAIRCSVTLEGCGKFRGEPASRKRQTEMNAAQEAIQWLEKHGASMVHADFIAAVRRQGRAAMPSKAFGHYSSRKIGALLEARFTAAYAECGLTVTIGKASVQPSAKADSYANEAANEPREFLWIELMKAAQSPSWGRSSRSPSSSAAPAPPIPASSSAGLFGSLRQSFSESLDKLAVILPHRQKATLDPDSGSNPDARKSWAERTSASLRAMLGQSA